MECWLTMTLQLEHDVSHTNARRWRRRRRIFFDGRVGNALCLVDVAPA